MVDEPPRPNADLVQSARDNDAYRRVLMTGAHLQVALMTIQPGREVGEELHPHTDQILYIVDGSGDAILDGDTSKISPGRLVFVAAGTRHNFVNTGEVPLRIATVYAPPEHAPGTVHETKARADAAEATEGH